MSHEDLSKLDNPVWYSLSESHKAHTITFDDDTQFYDPEYCPFGAALDTKKSLNAIDQYSKLSANFFIVGEKPEIPATLKIGNELVCLQMTIFKPIDIPITDTIIKLEESHREDLLELVKIVYPEYFKAKTATLGNYYGIYKDNQLVAITGERMQMNDFTEISAVITHPDHIGKGYAKQLVAHATNVIFNQNKTAFLHVYEKNFGAIKLYEKLGFEARRKISFWNITKNV
ncbi:GNAT family N-acetyltransferase [Flavobacterium hiemivividum]|uniref:GNAT family N-acetyltransferase n=1 Tax=Flavobacterium hiemivividum TaxID=2541734 RepID=A0A4R5CUQ7_9FLAO|nr:GNAT family N-acetyltransferase [Flavobacterium hiemivividum]TDE04146.1 GNAT family N-acetyltransferase [Flavobacterium hiemivividum]